MPQTRLVHLLILISLSIRASCAGAVPVSKDVTGCRDGDCQRHAFALNAQTLAPWKFGRVTIPGQKESSVSITKTANMLKSDPDFAGFSVRCGTQGKIDVLLILVRPLPPQARPRVTIGSGSQLKAMVGTMTAAGAAVVLPDEAAPLAGSAWQRLASLSITVTDGGDTIKGWVDLEGLGPAYANLTTSCLQ